MVGAVFRKPAKRESGSCRVIWADAMGQRSLTGPYYTIIRQNWNQFLLVVKTTALKQQISIFYPQIQRTDAIDHICVSQWPVVGEVRLIYGPPKEKFVLCSNFQ